MKSISYELDAFRTSFRIHWVDFRFAIYYLFCSSRVRVTFLLFERWKTAKNHFIMSFAHSRLPSWTPRRWKKMCVRQIIFIFHLWISSSPPSQSASSNLSNGTLERKKWQNIYVREIEKERFVNWKTVGEISHTSLVSFAHIWSASG